MFGVTERLGVRRCCGGTAKGGCGPSPADASGPRGDVAEKSGVGGRWKGWDGDCGELTVRAGGDRAGDRAPIETGRCLEAESGVRAREPWTRSDPRPPKPVGT